MKPIMFFYPPFEGKNYLKKRAPFPIGPLYLAAYLENQGIRAFVKDFSYPPKRGQTARPRELKTGQAGYFRWGYSDKRIRRYLERNLPEVNQIVGVSSLMSSNYSGGYNLIKIIKEVDPTRTVVLGGPHATAFPGHVFKNSQADYVCIGEGEQEFYSFLTDRPQEAIIGRTKYEKFKNVLELTRTCFFEPMDALPFPRRELLLDDRKTDEIYVTFSRACPHKCSFCGSHLIQGRKWRPKSPEKIISEIQHYAENWGVKKFVIEDDNPCPKGAGIIHFKKVLKMIIGLPKKYKFTVSHGIPVYATADKELCKMLWIAGFRKMSFPLESTNPEVLKDMNKENTPKYWRIGQKNWIWEKHKPAQIILGYPFVETIESMLQTMIDIAELKGLVWASHFRLNQGTELFQRCLKAGYISKDYDPINTQAFFIETERFNKTDLQELMQIGRGINFGVERADVNLFKEIIKTNDFYDFNPNPTPGSVVARGAFRFTRSQNIAAGLMLMATGNFKNGRPMVGFSADKTTLVYKGQKASRVYTTLYKLLHGQSPKAWATEETK